MYCGKKISVVMAVFNGEKHIKEQLTSILMQTIQPDEIVISDDGSKDQTIEIVKSFASENIDPNIEWLILTDNQRHGYTGNFEHALKHASGDYIFLCDQDDVWKKEKVSNVIGSFLNHPNAWLICHDAIMVDAKLNKINALFTPNFPREKIIKNDGELLQFDKETFLSKSVTETFPGMVMCLSRECVDNMLPIPKMNGHDTWAFFCAMCEERAFFLPKVLTYYRVHGTNESSPIESRRGILNRIKKYKRMLSKPCIYSSSLYEQSSAMIKRLHAYGESDMEKAYQKARDVYIMSSQLREAELSGRIKGCFMVIKLHARNPLYHETGTRQVLAHALNILLHSKKQRSALI